MNVDRIVTTTIDHERCTGCGLCVDVCPSETISMVAGKARITGEESLNCGHCMAVCPAGAISVAGLDPAMTTFRTFECSPEWTSHGVFDTGKLVNLMMSRRSCRNFQDKPVPRSLLEDLVRIGITAPSGSNCQKWSFTMVPDAAAVNRLGKKVARFYHKLNRMAEKPWLRTSMSLLGKPELEQYYHSMFKFLATLSGLSQAMLQSRSGFERAEGSADHVLFRWI